MTDHPPQGQDPYGQPPSDQPSYGDPTYGQPSSGQPSYGQPPVGGPAQGAPPPGYGSGSYAGGGYSSGPGPASSDSPKGFLGALFDFSFTSFVTPTIVKFVYILITIGLALAYVVFIIGGFASGEPSIGIAVLLLGWIPFLVYLALARMTLEFYFALVRMSEDIHHRLPER